VPAPIAAALPRIAPSAQIEGATPFLATRHPGL